MKSIFDPSKGVMKVACFMSGSGTNVRRIIDHQISLKEERGSSPFKVVVIFTDSSKSNAITIGKEYDIPVELNDIELFYNGRNIRDKTIREDYDKKTLDLIRQYNVDLIVLGGYAWVVTKPLISKYRIVNVHPADLSVMEDEKRKYIGLHHKPSMKAILAGEKSLHSSTHLVTEDLDMGPILIISKPVKIEFPYGINLEDLRKPENEALLVRVAKSHQDKLKEAGDWEIFPLTIQWISEGRFGIDENRNIFLDGKLIENGYRL